MDSYREWKPEKTEVASDLQKKSAKKASMNKRKIEKDFEGNKKEIENVVDDFSGNKKHKTFMERFRDISQRMGRIIGANSFQFFRGLEERIYEFLMLKFNPNYFDTEEFSVNVEKKEEDSYIFTLNVLDKELRKRIKDRFRDVLDV